MNLVGFINALLFIIVTIPIWGILSAILAVVAVGWGILLGILKLAVGLFAIINSIFKFVETTLPFGETVVRVLGSLIGEFFSTVIRMWSWGFSVPDWMWSFARYEHPWWAFIISIILLVMIPKWIK